MKKKNVLMLASEKKVEALRMATGLTLLDDSVSVATWGGLPDEADVHEQLEALEFMEVPIIRLDQDGAVIAELAAQILKSDVVYCV